MSLVFSAIVPHPPFLIPSVEKEAAKKIEKTALAIERLEEDLYVAHPDTIVIFSPHGHLLKEAFTINTRPEFHTDFRDFGDLTIKKEFKGELELASQIRESCKLYHLPSVMTSEDILDYGSAIPLLYLTRHLPDVRILPIGFSELGAKMHLDFGYLIKEQIMKSNKKIAVIASADLSQALSTTAPAGFNPRAKEFDEKIQELLSTGNTAGMLQIAPDLLESATECGFRSLLLLLGVLRGVQYTFKSYCYEAPLGVGYLTANCCL